MHINIYIQNAFTQNHITVKYKVENYYNYMLYSTQVVTVEVGFSIATVGRLSSFCACLQNSSVTWSPFSLTLGISNSVKIDTEVGEPITSVSGSIF